MEVEPNSPAIEDPSMEEDISQNENSDSLPGEEQVTESGAPVEDDYHELWLEFKCVFCSQDLKTILQPKLLPCLHTACESCLLSESNSETTGATSTASGSRGRGRKRSLSGPKHLRCPSCSQDIVKEEVVDHLFLTEYVQNLESLPEERVFPCTSCDEGADGSAFCEDCQEWLCDNCVNAHHRVRVTKDHTVRPKEEVDGDGLSGRNQKYMFCPSHSLEQLKLYCETCDKLTCRDCQLSDHKEHKYQFLQKACEEQKNNMSELVNKIKEKQAHILTASSNLEKKNEEILQRERALHQDIKVFAVRFVSEINRRAKALIDDLTNVCTEKKKLLSVKNTELKSMSEKLKHSEKFAEAAIKLGSETALVYSKKPIMNQLRRILKHRCEVPNPTQSVDIQFQYETVFLIQYISTLGKILVDQQPIGTSANQNAMLPMPGSSSSQALVPSSPMANKQMMRPQMQMNNHQQQMIVSQQQINQHATVPRAQLIQQQQFTQPLVTSSTDLSGGNSNGALRQVMTRAPAYNNRNIQRNNVQQQPQSNYNMQQQQHAYQQQRQLVPQQRQVVPQLQTQQQQPMRQQQHAQVIQQHHQPQQQQSAQQLPMPLRQNKSLSVTAVPTPSPTKPRNTGLTVTPTTPTSQQRAQQGARSSNGPQVIVLDDKQPNMSNTSRLSHFPQIASLANTHPNLQIQPASSHSSGNHLPQHSYLKKILSSSTHSQTVPPSSNIVSNSSPQVRSSVLHQALMNPGPTAQTSTPDYSNNSILKVMLDSPSHLDLLPTATPIQPNHNLANPSPDCAPIQPCLNPTVVPIQTSLNPTVSTVQPNPNNPTVSTSQPSFNNALDKEVDIDVPMDSDDSLPSLESLLKTFSVKEVQEEPAEAFPAPRNDPNDDYCASCLDGGDLVCCNTCPRVFHRSCHIPNLSVAVSSLGPWTCTLCRDPLAESGSPDMNKRKAIGLQGRNLKICERVLLEVMCHPNNIPFQHRVDKRVPNYYKIIKKPMELDTIRAKISAAHFEHYKNVEEFIDDMILLLKNCYTFNPVGSPLHTSGKQIENTFRSLLKTYLPDYVPYFSDGKLLPEISSQK